MGWRMARICHFLHQFSELCRDRDPHPDATPEAIEADLQELLRLLDEEMAALPPEIEHAEKVHAERVAIERDACLAPEGETWRVMLRQESALDRSIDRKVKIILGMRKNHIDDSLNDLTAEAGLKGDKNSDMDAEPAGIEPTPGYDIPYREPEPPEPPKHQNSRNKPGMFMKTKGGEPDGETGIREQGTGNRQCTVGSSEVGGLDRRL
jgi:hypothetical protein